MLIVRSGRMLGGKNFSFESVAMTDGEAIREFVLQYYKQGVEIPDEIICSAPITDEQLVTAYFKEKFSKSVEKC